MEKLIGKGAYRGPFLTNDKISFNPFPSLNTKFDKVLGGQVKQVGQKLGTKHQEVFYVQACSPMSMDVIFLSIINAEVAFQGETLPTHPRPCEAEAE